MMRLDSVYMTRGFDFPLLKEKPSRYIGQMFFCSQPLERPEDPASLEVAFRAINAETQLVWGSNFPSHDFDVPATIWDLPFLSEGAKTAILGGNAMRLFINGQEIDGRQDEAFGVRPASVGVLFDTRAMPNEAPVEIRFRDFKVYSL